MRLSIGFTGFGSLEATMPAILAAEEAGLDGVWSAEHLGFHDGIVPATMYLRATARLEVGIVGFGTGGRHPGMLAMELASLSELAQGRLRVAIGTGDATLVAKLGKEVRRPLTNVPAFVRSLREALAGRDMTVDLDEFRFDGFRLAPLGPVPPIDVMAIRPKMLAMSAAVGDGLSISLGASKEYLRETVALVEKHLAAAGRDRSEFRISAITVGIIGDDLDAGCMALGAMLSTFPQETAAYLARGAVDGEALVKAEREGGAFAVMPLWTAEAIREIALVSSTDALPQALADYAATGIDELCVMLVAPPNEQPHIIGDLAAARSHSVQTT
ncbi:MAG: LLM class flavin-dependent oxidoreductase [Acidimicrobiales bacterium]